MRLFESIINANHRALAGDPKAGVHVADYPDELPVVALTCIDPRLNRLFPGALGLPEEQFIWLRNAGNIIFDPMSSMMRTLALGCAIKGGKEIAVIGHTDCKVRQTTISDLTDRFKALGINRALLPENLTEFFGLFASERQNVIRGCEFIRSSPLIGPKVPVQGLLVDVETGKLEWIVNGYETLGRPTMKPADMILPAIGAAIGDLATLAEFKLGEMKFPETKIGETVVGAGKWLEQKIAPHIPPPIPQQSSPAAEPPPIERESRPLPLPPPIHPRPSMKIRRKD